MTVDRLAGLKTIFNSGSCVRRGLCPVTDIRNPDNALLDHSLYFEVHGTGPEKLVFIMGLNSSSFSWKEQVAHFSQFPDKYSLVVFDNRGVGNSDAPKGPYTYVARLSSFRCNSTCLPFRTSGMAEDVITLLCFIGWEHSDVHIVCFRQLATTFPR